MKRVRIRELERSNPTVGGEVGIEHDEPLVLPRELDERLSVGRDDVLVRHLRRRSSRAALGLSLEACGCLVLGRRHGPEPKCVEIVLGQTRVDSTDELGGGSRERVVVRRSRMPPIGAVALSERRRVLHEGDSPALDRPCDERLRPFVARAEALERVCQRSVLVTIARPDIPTERLELRFDLAEREDVVRPLVRLQLVSIDDHPELPEPVVRSGLQRLPVLALLQLAVSRHHHDATSAPKHALRERDPSTLRDAHAERAGIRLDPRDAHIGMTVETAQAPEPEQAPLRDHAKREEGGVSTRGRRDPSRRRRHRGPGARSRDHGRSARLRVGARRDRAR